MSSRFAFGDSSKKARMPGLSPEDPRLMKTRPLYEPKSLPVRVDTAGFPVTVGKARLKVTAVEDRWRIDDEWWRQQPLSRMYYALILENGERLVVYKDLISGCWYQQRG